MYLIWKCWWVVLMPEVLNGTAVFLHSTIPIWSWHFCFIKQHLVQSYGLRLYIMNRVILVDMISFNSLEKHLYLRVECFYLWGDIMEKVNLNNNFYLSLRLHLKRFQCWALDSPKKRKINVSFPGNERA